MQAIKDKRLAFQEPLGPGSGTEAAFWMGHTCVVQRLNILDINSMERSDEVDLYNGILGYS